MKYAPIFTALGLMTASPSFAQTKELLPVPAPVSAPVSAPVAIEDTCTVRKSYQKENVTINETYVDQACFQEKTGTVSRICNASFANQVQIPKDPAEAYLSCLNDTARKLYGVDRYTNGPLQITISSPR